MTGPIPANRLDELAAWLRTNRGAFTDEILSQQALAAGHSPADVEAAFARLASEDLDSAFAAPRTDDTPAPAWRFEARAHAGQAAHAPSRTRDVVLGFVVALGLIVGVPALLAFLGASNVAALFGFLAFIVALGAFGMMSDGENRGVAMGIRAALLVVIVVPIVAVVGVFGYCLVQGSGI